MKGNALAQIMISAMAMGVPIGGELSGKFGEDPLEDVDLEKEYELIQQKKSRLSATKRRMVVARVERIRPERFNRKS